MVLNLYQKQDSREVWTMCEHENDFDVSTEKYEKKDFLKKVKPLLAIAILLTAVCSFVGILY